MGLLHIFTMIFSKKAPSLIVLPLVLLSNPPKAFAEIIASDDFTSGLNSGGSGWDNDWTTGSNGPSDGAVDFAASTAPLGSNGNYASITGSGSNITQGIHREYTSALIDIEDEHTVSFLFRIDASSPDASGDASRVLVTHGATSFGLSANSSWAFYIQEGNFFYFDGDGSGGFAPAQRDSGVAVTVGDLYSVTVTNRIGADTPGSPSTGGEWDLLVTNLTEDAEALNLTNLEFRRRTVPTTANIGLGTAGASATLANETSFDQVIIDGPSNAPPAPLTITEFEYDPEAETVTLTWNNTGAESYAVNASPDLLDWELELDDSIDEERDENPEDLNRITITLPLLGTETTKLFFRVEEN